MFCVRRNFKIANYFTLIAYVHSYSDFDPIVSLDSNFELDVRDFCVGETFTHREQHIGEFNEKFARFNDRFFKVKMFRFSRI